MDTVWSLKKVPDVIGLHNLRGTDHTSVTRGAGAHGDQTNIGYRRRGMNELIGAMEMIVGLTKGIVMRNAPSGGRSRLTSPLRNPLREA